VYSYYSKSEEDRLSEKQEVDTLLQGFKSPDSELQGAKSIVRQNYPRDFAGACAFLGAMIANVHGAAQLENMRYRQSKHRISALSGREYGRGGQGCGRFTGCYGRGGRGRGGHGRGGREGRGRGRVFINGIDCSDPTKSFSPSDWDALRGNGRAYVQQQCEIIANRDGRSQASRGRGREGRLINAVQTSDADDQVSQITTSTAATGRGSQNGSRFGRGAYGQGRGGRS